MRKLLCLVSVTILLSGCASNCRNGIITNPCASDSQCYRDSYSIVWDSWCRNGCRDYPVSYRTKQTEYIVLPEGTNTCMGDCGGAR